jgi:phosphoglycolate phosphatase-like HAD superfamily hydrolase
MSSLVIFDVDGTLIKSKEVDGICYVRSITDEFDIESIDTKWEIYKTATDSGILEEIFEKNFNRKPSKFEIQRHINKFVSFLNEYSVSDNNLFKEIKGANNILHELKNNQQWKIGIATGGWREPTLFKLKAAGIDIEGLPFSSSSEATKREDILLKCIDTSKNHYGIKEFNKIVSIGDAIWDVEIANVLGIGFIGINNDGQLRNIPNAIIFDDYSDKNKFFESLEKVKAPHI